MKKFGIIILAGVLIAGYILITSDKPDKTLSVALVDETVLQEDGVQNGTDSIITDDETDDVFAHLEGLDLVDIDPFSTEIKFIGYGPGKSHEAVFENVVIQDFLHDDQFLIKNGQLVFFSNSIKTDNPTLDTHLCAENFLDCENYNVIVFIIKNSRYDAGEDEMTVTGDLEFKGVHKAISFPVKIDRETNTYTADFRLNVKEFGFSGPGVNEEVQIKFNATK